MRYKFWPLVISGMVLVIAACVPLFQEEVRPVRNYSKNYFFHVVRYQGETLSLIARWYTGSDKNVTELKRQNRYIADENEELPLKSRILIPRRILQTMKLMPVGYIRKHSPALDEEERMEPTEAVPTPRPTRTPTRTPSPSPTETPTRTPTSTPRNTPVRAARATATPTPWTAPPDEPEPTPTRPPRPTTRSVIRMPNVRRDFSEEDPAEASNPLIQIPPEIVDDLKKMAPKPTAKPVENFPAEALQPLPPIGESEFVPDPTPAPRYEREIPAAEVEAEPTISEDRKRLLDMMKDQGNE